MQNYCSSRRMHRYLFTALLLGASAGGVGCSSENSYKAPKNGTLTSEEGSDMPMPQSWGTGMPSLPSGTPNTITNQ